MIGLDIHRMNRGLFSAHPQRQQHLSGYNLSFERKSKAKSPFAFIKLISPATPMNVNLHLMQNVEDSSIKWLIAASTPSQC
jgi:hypothetical protein